MKQPVEMGAPASTHPCFNARAAATNGRVHLPVAPDCNIQCGYCHRVYDCANENRPGVTSRILGPEEAVDYLNEMLALAPCISVVGIAGPGDAFCDPQRTLETLELVRRDHPRLDLCISTNGLGIGPFIGELSRLRVGYVTVTVNAADIRTGARVYRHINKDGNLFRGTEAAGILLEAQWDAISGLKARGITVKVNTVVIRGENEADAERIAERAASLGADIMNIIGMIPVPGTAFERFGSPSPALLNGLRLAAGRFLPQMRHCVRCRSDAAGLLGCDGSRHCLEHRPGAAASA